MNTLEYIGLANVALVLGAIIIRLCRKVAGK